MSKVFSAHAAAGDKDVGLMGGGRSFFHQLPEHVDLRLLEVIPAPGVTHLHYEVVR
jgi:hypothetical protein